MDPMTKHMYWTRAVEWINVVTVLLVLLAIAMSFSKGIADHMGLNYPLGSRDVLALVFIPAVLAAYLQGSLSIIVPAGVPLKRFPRFIARFFEEQAVQQNDGSWIVKSEIGFSKAAKTWLASTQQGNLKPLGWVLMDVEPAEYPCRVEFYIHAPDYQVDTVEGIGRFRYRVHPRR